MDILLIGCGKMGGAMLGRWVEATDHSFTVVDPAASDLPASVRHETSAKGLGGDRFDMMIIAVKPQMIAKVVPAYKDHLAAAGCVVSVAAGFSHDRLSELLGGAPIIRVMPNLPALIGEGATGLFAGSGIGRMERNVVTALMGAVGKCFWVGTEDELDRLTAISGSGPGYVFQFIESYMAAAGELGFSEGVARTLVVQTLLGAARMAETSAAPVAELRQSVTSKKGTTEAGLLSLNKKGRLDTLLSETLSAAYGRAVELR